MNIEIKDNIVFNDGQQIGSIKNNICYSDAAIGGPIKGAINKAFGSKLNFVIGKPSAEEDGIVDHEAVSSEEPQTIEDLLALAKAGAIPQPPPQRPDAGGKTPAFIAWVKHHVSPDVFQSIYGHRKYTMDESEIDKGNEAHRRRLDAMEKNKSLPLA